MKNTTEHFIWLHSSNAAISLSYFFLIIDKTHLIRDSKLLTIATFLFFFSLILNSFVLLMHISETSISERVLQMYNENETFKKFVHFSCRTNYAGVACVVLFVFIEGKVCTNFL